MSEKSTAKTTDVDKLRINERKWSKELMSAGWTVMPSIIIEKQEALGLDALDMNIILHLAQYWWTPENLPRPSVETIAKAVGVQKRAVQKRIAALQQLGLIEREERRETPNGSLPNLYSFNGLIEAAKPFAKEKLAEIEEAVKAKADRERAKAERIARKKPKLAIVKS